LNIYRSKLMEFLSLKIHAISLQFDDMRHRIDFEYKSNRQSHGENVVQADSQKCYCQGHWEGIKQEIIWKNNGCKRNPLQINPYPVSN